MAFLMGFDFLLNFYLNCFRNGGQFIANLVS